MIKSETDLKKILESIDHKGYPAYKETKGAYQFGKYILTIEHVQGDPFAAPSQVRLVVSGKSAGLPSECYDKRHKRIAVQDYLLRKLAFEISKKSFDAKGSGKSGLLSISHCGQEILERSACQINAENGDVTIRMEIGFPAYGRTINAKELEKILFQILPEIINKVMLYKNMDKNELKETICLAENQFFIRNELKNRGFVAFIADGSILPRESGVSAKPLKNAVKFHTPESMRVEMSLPNGNAVCGMGIPEGITLIVGGGYHGKSTLLEALEKGVYNHISGDGREYVITNAEAVKVRAEDGRSISGTDISMFINNLPSRVNTKSFYTENASGSTSQAANVVEAMETGCKVLFIDEDTSATNFMIRDELMQLVVAKDKEPITPYIDRIRDLYNRFGVSTVLVAGSSGEYFEKADRIIQMDEYRVLDITESAKKIAQMYQSQTREVKKEEKMSETQIPDCDRIALPYKEWIGERIKIKVNKTDDLNISKDNIDTRYLEQLVDKEQLRAIGYIMVHMNEYMFGKNKSLQNAVSEVIELLEKEGFEGIMKGKYVPCDLAIPRKQEILMSINRFRKLKLQKSKNC